MMKVTVPGKRYYANEMHGFAEAKTALRMLSDIKIRAYDHEYRRMFFPEGYKSDPFKDSKRPVYEDICSMGVNSIYANALEPYVKGILKSQVSNLKNYISKAKDDIESMTNKVSSLKESLERKQNIKSSIVRYAKTGLWECRVPSVCVTSAGKIRGFGIKEQDILVYKYYLEEQIRRTKRNISSVTEGIRRLKKKITRLEQDPPARAVFGSRKLYRQKDTKCSTKEEREAWKKEFDYARHSSVTLSGRKDSNNGNYLVKWNERTHDLVWNLPDGSECVFPGYLPERHADSFISLLENNNFAGSTVAYTINLRVDSKGKEYFLVWASFDLKDDGMKNFYTGDGVISVDINADCLAWAETDGKGKRLTGGTIPMDLSGLSTNRASDTIGRAVRLLITECELSHKPLVREKLDSKGFYSKQKYGNKTKNRKVSQFAFERIIQTIENQAFRAGICVFTVYPAYTSFAAKLLYIRKYGISTHEASAYVIGLLGMGICPEVPEKYAVLYPKKTKDPKDAGTSGEAHDIRGFQDNWRPIYNALKKVRAHTFYLDIPSLPNKRGLLSWIKEHDILHPQKGIALTVP